MPSLVVIEGANLGDAIELRAEPVTLGRLPNCDLPIRDERVSRRHCRVRQAVGGFLVEDLDSANGTYLNGRRIGAGAMLTPGDEIRVGNTTLRFTDSDGVHVRSRRRSTHEEDLMRTRA